jgi:hypothetical protein
VCESAGEEIESFLGSVCSRRFNLDVTKGKNSRKLSVVLAKPNDEHHLRYLLCFSSFNLCVSRL